VRIWLLIALAAGAAAMAAALLAGEDDSGRDGAAGAGTSGPEVSIMDDQLLLGAPADRVDRAMESFRVLGFDRLRVSAFWRDHAPAPLSQRRPGALRYDWDTLDRVVRSAARHRLKVMITITTPAPLWATEEPGRRSPVWRPRADEFARFAEAVAARYAAQADQYGVLNEPNQGGWLQPQSSNGRPVAPHVYRELVRAAYPAIRRADPSAAVLVGELASSGRDQRGARRPLRPIEFLRELACVDRSWRPRRDGPCEDFEAVPLDALGHHPYQPFAAPDTESPDPDDAGIGDGRRLAAVLDRLVAADRLRPGGDGPLPIHYTEFGYQTDPPDPLAGIPLARQGRWLQEAAHVAWRERDRVRSLNQFRLTDGALVDASGNARYREFQSGLYFADFGPKPAARSFPHPLVIRPGSGGRTEFFGQARRATAPGVTLERASQRTGPWERVRSVGTDARGYFSIALSRPEPGVYRYSYGAGERRERSEPVALSGR
jgi:Cellulase (glycosyl hydrolase family 5)